MVLLIDFFGFKSLKKDILILYFKCDNFVCLFFILKEGYVFEKCLNKYFKIGVNWFVEFLFRLVRR